MNGKAVYVHWADCLMEMGSRDCDDYGARIIREWAHISGFAGLPAIRNSTTISRFPLERALWPIDRAFMMTRFDARVAHEIVSPTMYTVLGPAYALHGLTSRSGSAAWSAFNATSLAGLRGSSKLHHDVVSSHRHEKCTKTRPMILYRGTIKDAACCNFVRAEYRI